MQNIPGQIPLENLIDAGIDPEDIDEEEYEALQVALLEQMQAEGEEFVIRDDDEEEKKGA